MSIGDLRNGYGSIQHHLVPEPLDHRAYYVQMEAKAWVTGWDSVGELRY